jgi:hypothetical protein
MIGKWASLDDRLTNGVAMGGVPEHNPDLGRCHLWCGSINGDGYGTIGDGGKVLKVHRLMWERAYGPIPKGRQIDHRCFVRHCVRLDHLRLATNKQNQEHHDGPKRNSKSGVRGVFPNGNHWMVMVGHNGKQIYFGTYHTLEEAEKVAVARRNELHTHNDVDRREAS